MNALVWRQHRAQLLTAAVLLGVFAVVVLITGMRMADDYHSALATCAANGSCSDLPDLLFRGDGAIIDIIGLTTVVPALMGLFWGAPLVAREVEEGTHRLVWTQAVPRRRWFLVKVGWVVAAAAVWGAVISALVSWWARPENSLHQYRFLPGHFDIQGVVPIAYALFAVALGIAAGGLLRRTLPALAVTVGVFVAVRLIVNLYVRPNFQAARTLIGGLRSNPPGSAWVLSTKIRLPNGQTTDALRRFADPNMARCLQASGNRSGLDQCMTKLGYAQITRYQPGNRFWTFQFMEAGIFVVLAAGLLVAAYFLVIRRDA